MKKETAIEFLFFSYFGIDISIVKKQKDEKQIFNTLLEAAIDRAYRDAASHVLTVDSKFELSDEQKNKVRKIYKVACIKKIIQYFKEILVKKELNQDWVEDLATALKEIYLSDIDSLIKDYKIEGIKIKKQMPKYKIKFTFGIAQKWINMSIKNIHIMNTIIKECYKTNEECNESKSGLLDKLCKTFSDDKAENLIDVPVDDYIIQAACNRGVKVPCEDEQKIKMINDYQQRLAWSKWELSGSGEENYYRNFQEEFKSCADFKDFDGSILDCENRLWINQAINN